MKTPKLQAGYAETSSTRYPRNPETVIVPQEALASAVCVGPARIDGSYHWWAFKIPGKKRFYFQTAIACGCPIDGGRDSY